MVHWKLLNFEQCYRCLLPSICKIQHILGTTRVLDLVIQICKNCNSVSALLFYQELGSVFLLCITNLIKKTSLLFFEIPSRFLLSFLLLFPLSFQLHFRLLFPFPFPLLFFFFSLPLSIPFTSYFLPLFFPFTSCATSFTLYITSFNLAFFHICILFGFHSIPPRFYPLPFHPLLCHLFFPSPYLSPYSFLSLSFAPKPFLLCFPSSDLFSHFNVYNSKIITVEG